MKKTLVIATIAMLGFGGYIGYTTNYTTTATAHELTIPRFVDVPKQTGFDLNINLNKNTVECNSTEQGVNVNIERKDSIVYRTKIVTKTINKYIERRNHFPLRETKQNLLELCTVEPNPQRIQQ